MSVILKTRQEMTWLVAVCPFIREAVLPDQTSTVGQASCAVASIAGLGIIQTLRERASVVRV